MPAVLRSYELKHGSPKDMELSNTAISDHTRLPSQSQRMAHNKQLNNNNNELYSP